MTVTYALSVTRQDSGAYIAGTSQGYRVILTVTVVSGFSDAGVFCFIQEGQQNFFTNICSPADLADWLYQVPDPTTGRFRLHVADLTYPSKDVAEQLTAQIMGQLDTLCKEMARLANDLGTSGTTILSSNDP
jgi:hypothetical protein